MTRTAKGLVATIAAVVGLVAMISVASAAVSSLVSSPDGRVPR
jgi:hypothetical protein